MSEYADIVAELAPTFDVGEVFLPSVGPRHLLLCLHGIRDDSSFATLSEEIAGRFASTRIEVIPIRYRRVSMTDACSDRDLAGRVSDVVQQIEFVFAANPGCLISILCHSFGTRMLAMALDSANFRFEWVFLCSSVARVETVNAYRRASDRIVNDAAERDRVPILAEAVRPTVYQATGVFGFHRFPVKERIFDYGHSGSVGPNHLIQWVFPALANGVLPRTPHRDWGNRKHLPTYLHRMLWPLLTPIATIARMTGYSDQPDRTSRR